MSTSYSCFLSFSQHPNPSTASGKLESEQAGPWGLHTHTLGVAAKGHLRTLRHVRAESYLFYIPTKDSTKNKENE